MKNARIEGATARDHESLALSTSDAGAFVVEMVRSNAADAGERTRDVPVSGKVTIRAFGQTREVPFTLTGARTQVARVDARWEAELVPVDDDFAVGLGPFDRGAASAALGRISVRHCSASGQSGSGRVVVTFSPTGRVANVDLSGSPLTGTPAGRCVTAAFFGAAVPPFDGGPVRVAKSFVLE
jgi:hypothetical protein